MTMIGPAGAAPAPAPTRRAPETAAHHDLVAALAEADGEALVLAHVDAPPRCAESLEHAVDDRPTGALLLSTIRSASA